MMNKKLFNNTILVFVALLLCKFVAFFQEMIMAASFGANYLSDSFNTVYGIKQAVFPMFVVGINQVFLPIYKKKLVSESRQDLAEFSNYVITISSIAVLILVIIIFCFTPIVVSIVAPGFSDIAKGITVSLVKISVFSYFAICLSAILSSMIMADGHFFISNIASSLQHICVIIAILIFYSRVGITALAWALVIGSILQVLIQLPYVQRGYRYKFTTKIKRKDAEDFYRKLPASFLSSGITQVNTLIDRAIASSLTEGSVSILNYGSRVFSVLLDLCGQIFSTASYPHMIELIVNRKWDELGKLLREITEMIWLVTIPMAIFGTAYSKQVISILFGHGAFDHSKVLITSSVLNAYIIALPISSVTNIYNNVYFGDGNTNIPMKLNFLNLLINIALNMLLVKSMGISGLAYATSVSITIVFFLRYLMLSKKIGYYFIALDKNLSLIFFSSIVSCMITTWATKYIASDSVIVTCVIALLIGSFLYFAILFAFRMPLITDIRSSLSDRASKN